jgi:glycosyltransferase involved in cell wall biosynthesis
VSLGLYLEALLFTWTQGTNMKKEDLPIKYNRSYPHGIPYVSIVIATFNKAAILDKTLTSIRANVTDIPYDIIVVDDGSHDDTRDICQKHACLYVWVNFPSYRNPSVPRNMGCRIARGELLIMQSDDVLHESTDTIEKLADLERGSVNFAAVCNVSANLTKGYWMCHKHENPAPLFFLGSMYRDDFWAIGGNDEDFTNPGHEDTYLGELIKRNYKINWRSDIVGLHQNHGRPRINFNKCPSRYIFDAKMKELEEKL